MATQSDFYRSYGVNTAASAGRLVSVSNNGKVGPTAINARPVGTLEADVTTDAFCTATVRLPGTGTARISVTGGPLTIGDLLYSVTNGQVAGTNGGTGGQVIGILHENVSAANNGTLAEVLPQIT